MKIAFPIATALAGLLAVTGCGSTQTAASAPSASDSTSASASPTATETTSPTDTYSTDPTPTIVDTPTPVDAKSIDVTDAASLQAKFEAAGGVCKNPQPAQMTSEALPSEGIECGGRTYLYFFDSSDSLVVDRWCSSENELASMLKQTTHVAYGENWGVESPQAPKVAKKMGGTAETYPL